MGDIRRILIPTDFSDCAKHAVDYVRGLSWARDTEVLLVHIIEPVAYPMYQVIGAADYGKLDEEVRKSCNETLDKLKAEFGEWKGGVRTIVREGFPNAEIIACAEEEQVDLIVIATHGRTGLGHLLLGSSTEAVVRGAKCPVLTVR